MRVLFWNTHNNEDINSVISEIVLENNINIIVLAEYCANINSLIDELSVCGKCFKQCFTVGCDRIKILSSNIKIEPDLQGDYASIQIINDSIILCSVHLNSKIYSEHSDDREIIIQRLIKDIRDIEIRLQTENTIIVGDFNANPYENEFINARYLHSLPVFSETKRKSRTIKGEEFYMFYNPMWNFLGDFSEPYGTYYHSGSNATCTFWNIYDQVIIRPALREKFIKEKLKIITETESKFLLDAKGHPDINISDHLPIIFEIEEDSNGT